MSKRQGAPPANHIFLHSQCFILHSAGSSEGELTTPKPQAHYTGADFQIKRFAHSLIPVAPRAHLVRRFRTQLPTPGFSDAKLHFSLARGLSLNLPNTLTLSRIFIVPVLVVILMTEISEYWFGIPRQIPAVILFVAASITDLLDGYLARRRGEVTTLGTLLDPIADKLLISAALISLVENKLAPGWAVVIIIGREFAVSGLRTIASQQGLAIGASKMGKFKMMSQVVAITLLMLGSQNGGPPQLDEPTSRFAVTKALNILMEWDFSGNHLQVLAYGLGRAVMWTVVVSSLWSMYNYFKDFYGGVRDQIEVRKFPPIREALAAKFRRRGRPSRRATPTRPDPPQRSLPFQPKQQK